jgi:tetratricopeptide (TPR) repeat protein
VDEALACYRKAAELNPNYAAADCREYKQLTLGRARLAFRLKPDDAGARDALAEGLNSLAWDLAANAKTDRRQPGRAVSLAGEAVEFKPREGDYFKTLGVALFRAERWQDAIETLETADRLGGGKDFGCNALFLAMAHWQLDNKEQARAWYDRAVEWVEKNPSDHEELRRFRTEAAGLMKGERNKD